jgi:ribonucleoside-diphosphate reductase alpha chain
LTELSQWADTIYKQKYAQEGETWPDTAKRVVDNVMRPYFPELSDAMEKAITERKFLPGGRYIAQAGKSMKQYNNCVLFDVEDSREGWAELMHKVTLSSMTGAGVGVCYSKLRPKGAKIAGNGGESSGPLALMQMVNEAGRFIKAGGSRRAAIYASLHWNHADIFEFIEAKDWSDEIKAMKEKDFNAYAPMDGTNMSVILDDDFFVAYHDERHHMHEWAHRVYDETVKRMLTTAEPGFQIDCGENAGEHMRNACTEVTSADDSDICNLGSINLANVETKEEFQELVTLGTAFLLAGSIESTVPHESIRAVREKNRRLGLGLMGIYEWLVKRGYSYDPNEELGSWLEDYAKSTEIAAVLADRLGVSHPVKTRAIAPTGTIAIIAETTSGIEPLFAGAYKRRYLADGVWKYQYVIDATAQRLMDKGVDFHSMETAYDLAKDPERRIAFQAWLQHYVDMGISSTLNLPAVEQQNFTHMEFGDMLIKYLPHLRGVTAYPDGARGGQPLNVVPLEEALGWEGVEFEEFGSENACVSGVCGI